MRIKLAMVLVVVLLGVSPFLIPKRVFGENALGKPRSITLLNRKSTAKHDNYDKATVSFRYGLDAYEAKRGVRNDRDLLYGALNYLGDRDWFTVAFAVRDQSRIRDLGEMDWSDDIAVPVLPILPCPANASCHGIRIPPSSSGKKIHDEDVNPHLAKPRVGHMYVVHTKDRELNVYSRYDIDTYQDFYTLFRVEELIPNESCTITWRRIPSPKK